MSSMLGHVGQRVASEQDRALEAAETISSEVILAGIQKRRRRAQTRARVMGGAAAALVMLLVAVFGVLRSRAGAGPLAASGNDLPAAAAAVVAPPALGVTHADVASVPLAFEDGTKVVVQRGATADLKEVRKHGATIALREGTVLVDVVHTEESRWDVNAGAFGIRVTGTRFDATYDPVKKQLTVAMAEGTVRVSGPCVNEPLSAPAKKVFECPDAPSAPPPVPVESLAPAAPPQPSAHALASPPAPGTREGHGPGVPGAGVHANEKATSSAGVATAPAPPAEPTADGMLAEADAARLAGDGARARALYTKIRERFPRGPQAARSAFLLGRMAQSSGSVDEAARWFEVAAREQGAFSQEALGRLVELEQKRGNGERARQLAAEYLRTYPNGAYAAYATSVADAQR